MPSSSAPFTLHEGSLHVVPVCHERFEFAHEVRRAILSVRPAAIAIELHPEVQEIYLEAVRRFPFLSYVEQHNVGSDAPLLIEVEPTDAFAEAVRTGIEADIPVHFVDLNVLEYPATYDPMPDSYALYQIGLGPYHGEYARVHGMRNASLEKALSEEHGDVRFDRPERLHRQLTGSHDRNRELHMGCRLARLLDEARGGDVLFVCGMAHATAVLRHAIDRTGRAGMPAPVREVKLLNPDLDVVRAASGEIPFLIAAYEFDRKGPGDERAWEAKKDAAPPPEEPTPLQELSQQDVLGALESLLGMGPKNAPREITLTPQLLRALSRKLGGMRDPRTLLGLLGADPRHIPRLPAIPDAAAGHRIFKFRNVDDRRPELRHLYADAARLRNPHTQMLDRQRVSVRMMNVAARFYEDNTGDRFKRWQLRTLLQFIRSWCRIRGMLLPRQWWDWTVAARGVADDNYAYEVWDLASFYPWIDGSERFGGLDLEGFKLRQIRFRRRWPRFRERFMKPPVRPRKQEEHTGDWAREFESGTICSYPPEDILIEDYGRYLKKKALLVLSEERTRVEPFTTSLLDGIDVRETIRNWPRTRRSPVATSAPGPGEGARIYVREIQKVKGGAGAVVVIFDDDLRDERYPWKMTWHGEHDQESDMAFYATPIYAKVVGPGIARCEYGGLMLAYPPRRVMDVWNDPFYHQAQTKSEVLLLAGLEYSKEKHVVYVAARPPRSIFRTLANQVGKKIVYLPIGQLSPVTIKKLRVFHVLSGHHVRDFAKDYVW